MELSEKLRDNFDEMVVYKDLKKTNFFSALSLPAFMRDWLLKKFEDDEGNFNKDDLARFVKKFIPRKDDWNAIKNDIVIEGKTVKFLAKVSVNIDIIFPGKNSPNKVTMEFKSNVTKSVTAKTSCTSFVLFIP